jgi:hypothetical protein
MPRDEQGFPIVPHEFIEPVDCCGCLIVEVRGDQADLICNECGAVVRTLPADTAAAVLAEMEMASAEICSSRCPHCQALNTFPGFSSIDAFICSECGEGVAVNTPIQ